MATPVTFTLGKYEIIEQLGQSANAMVYKAYHRDIDRYLAIKVFRPQYDDDPEFGEHFRQESRKIARLQHPHIVPLFDYGNEDDVWFLAMAYIQGGTLADLMDGGPLPLPQVDKILRGVVSALDYAHRKGIVHRDIKPNNILLDTEGHALLTDFGIANIVGSGTIFLGQENASEPGKDEAEDRQHDIYALGSVTFEMLTGQPPYQAATYAASMLLRANGPVPSVSRLREQIPQAVETTMQRVMAKNPEERYPTALDFYEDFSRAFHSDDSVVEINLGMRSQAQAVTAVSPEAGAAPDSTLILDGLDVEEAPSKPKRRVWRVALVAIAMLAAVSVILGSVAARPALSLGSLTFSTSASAGDLGYLKLDALPSPASGKHYVAWLENSSTQAQTKMGSFALNDLGTGSLAYADPDGNALLSLYDRVVISAETDDTTSSPGVILYSGQIPAQLSPILTELLVKSNQLPPEASIVSATYGPATKPLNSLLDGLVAEAGIGEMHSGLAAKAPNIGALKVHAEHTINIMLGTKDDYNGNGRGENPGRKIGVPFFLDKIDALVNSNAETKATFGRILACTQNMRTWMNRVIAFEHDLLDTDDINKITSQKNESTGLATDMMEGIDANQNGEIEFIDGECGLQQITDYALHMASMNLVAEAS
ncbi:MAG: serine/threonine-protein kinase [Chloroflexota bacterium]